MFGHICAGKISLSCPASVSVTCSVVCVSIKCFNISNSRFFVRGVTHCQAFCKQGLSRINLSRTFFFQLFTDRFKTFFSNTSLLSGVIVVGSCLLLRSSTASQWKSSSTLVLLTAFSMKLYSSAAFVILRPQDLQTRSDKFLFLVNRNPIEPQPDIELKSAPHFQLFPTAKINFQMRLVLPQK